MATQEEADTMKAHITQLIEQNEALQASVETIQQQQLQEKTGSHHGEPIEPEPQPLSAEIWNAAFPDNFKPPHLPTFDGRGDPMEHVTPSIIEWPSSEKPTLSSANFWPERSTMLRYDGI